MKNPYRKWRDEHVLFLDDGFDSDDAYDRLVQGGFNPRRFRTHFRRDDGRKEENVKDPVIIKLCNREGWLLVTTDSSMVNMHRKEIAASPKLGILATAHNNPDDIMEWVEGLIQLKPLIERNSFKKRERPWYAQFNRQGRITVGPRLVVWKATDGSQ